MDNVPNPQQFVQDVSIPSKWRDITGNASRLPSFTNNETGETIRAFYNASEYGFFVHSIHHESGVENPVATGGREEIITALEEHMSEYSTTPSYE